MKHFLITLLYWFLDWSQTDHNHCDLFISNSLHKVDPFQKLAANEGTMAKNCTLGKDNNTPPKLFSICGKKFYTFLLVRHLPMSNGPYRSHKHSGQAYNCCVLYITRNSTKSNPLT